MTRIGFAYNLKPDAGAPAGRSLRSSSTAMSRADAESPRSRRDTLLLNGALAPVTSPRGSAYLTAASADTDEFAEWDTAETIDAVARSLATIGTVIRLEADADFPVRLRETNPDLVFNIAEGLHGVNREAHVPAICEFFGVPYSGSDPLSLSLCLDKARTKEILSFHGVPTAPFMLVRSRDELGTLRTRLAAPRARRAGTGLRLPLFVKPVHEGSSKGITERNFCRTLDALDAQVEFLLERYEQPVIIEEYLPGAEFTCAVLGNGDAARVLPIVAMRFGTLPPGALPIYGFEAKWVWDRPEHPLDIFECPAQIDEPLRRRIEDVTLRSYRVLGCRDWARIDVRLDADGAPHVVEVNPLPGILPNPEDNSCFPKAARAAGLGYSELIQECARSAAARYGLSLGTRRRRTATRMPVGT